MRQRPSGNQPLSLHTDGRLSLYTLGCGAAFSKTLGNNNWLALKGETSLLIDCGSKTPQRLHSCQVDPSDIGYFLVTHSHADHIGGLEEVMLRSRYIANKRPGLIIEQAYRHQLWQESLRGGCAYNEVVAGRFLELEDFFNIETPRRRADLPRNAAEIDLGPLNIKIFRTLHIPEQARHWQEAAYSVSVLLDERVLFTGDTQFDPELLEQLDELFALEAIFHDAQVAEGSLHASLGELATLSTELRSRIWLMHYEDHWQEHTELAKRAGLAGFTPEFTYLDFT